MWKTSLKFCKKFRNVFRAFYEMEIGSGIWMRRLWTPSTAKKIKVFCDATTHHGGSRSYANHAGSGKHITLVIAASASGLICPPFFIVAGVNVMESWFLPLATEGLSKALPKDIVDLSEPDWFPKEGVVCCTERGSMDARTLQLFIQHIDRTIRKHISNDKEFLLTLDNHGSRKGVDWIEVARRVRCEVVLHLPTHRTFCSLVTSKLIGVSKMKCALCETDWLFWGIPITAVSSFS